MEAHVATQVERIGQPVRRNFPGLGERRRNGTGLGDARQAFEDVAVNDAVDRGRGAGGWIKVWWLQRFGEDKLLGADTTGGKAEPERNGGGNDRTSYRRHGILQEDGLSRREATVAITLAEFTMSSMPTHSSG